MADYYQREYSSTSPLLAGFVGLVLGATGAAVALLLSNPENRRKVQEQVDDFRQRGGETLEDLRNRAMRAAEELQGKAETAREEAEKYSHDMERKVKGTAKEASRKANEKKD